MQDWGVVDLSRRRNYLREVPRAWQPSPHGVDAFTKLLLHFDGVDASTTFTDSSASAHVVTAVDNAQIDTAQSKFGGASGLFDGTGDALTIPDSADFDFGTGDFTIDCWVRFADGTESHLVAGRGPTNGDLMFGRLADGTLRMGRAQVAWDSTSTVQTWTNGTWYHVAVSRTSGTLKLFKDGAEIFSGANTNSYNITNATVAIGAGQAASGSGTLGYFLNGHMDELRISKGVGRYSGTFTPVGPYF